MSDCFLTVAERSDPLPISASHPKLTDLTEDAPASRAQLLTISRRLFLRIRSLVWANAFDMDVLAWKPLDRQTGYVPKVEHERTTDAR